MMKPALLVLAAGMGSRYGGLKQIDPVGPSGEAVLDYSVYDALRAGFGKIVFVIRRDIEEAFRRTVGARYEDRVDVEYAFQELDMLPEGFSLPADRTKPWGTAHAILSAHNVIDTPFAVINADDFYGAESYRILSKQLAAASENEYAMVGYRLRHTLSDHGSVARGVCEVDASNILTGVEEVIGIEKVDHGAEQRKPDGAVRHLTGDEIVSMNMWGFTPSVFSHLNTAFAHFLADALDQPKAEFFIPSVVSDLTEARKATVHVLKTESAWFGITYREDKPQVVKSIRALVDRGVYPEQLWS